MSKIIDLPLEESERLRHNRFMLCKGCVGTFRCPFCYHLADEDDISTISDDHIPPEAHDPEARGSDDMPSRDERPEATVRYVADYHDDGIWCILDDGANCTLMGQTASTTYNRPEVMPEFLFLGIDAELALLATFS